MLIGAGMDFQVLNRLVADIEAKGRRLLAEAGISSGIWVVHRRVCHT
jgi:hypothetical protein